tara:strand:- start:2350 stop:2547 length:198 start_codon:yes stop_codon:yes gene_type:complete
MTVSANAVFPKWIDRYEASGSVQKGFIANSFMHTACFSRENIHGRRHAGNLDIKFPIVGTSSVIK